MPTATKLNRAARIKLRMTSPDEVLSPAAFQSFVVACEDPASPTAALQELMARRKAMQPTPSQGIVNLPKTKAAP